MDPRQPWKLGTPKADRGDQLGKPGHSPIKPPAQRRMGVKRRPVDQCLWFNAGVIVAPARFSWLYDTTHLRRRHREIRPATDLDARLPMHGARNLNPVITLKNLLRRTCCPQAGGRCSVTGRLWPFPDRDGETGPATRLLAERNPDPRPDGCLRDQRGRINVADVIARRGYPMLRSAWRPHVPGVGGRSPGKSKARARRQLVNRQLVNRCASFAPGSSRQRSPAESPATSGRA